MAKNSHQHDEDEPEEDGFEVVEEGPKSRRKRRTDSDEEPRSRRDDRDSESPPKKKKKKKKRISQVERSSFIVVNWAICGPMILCGLILCFVAAGGMAGKGEAFRAILIMLLAIVITIPLTVGALIAAGMTMNIDYGEWKAAIVKLTAVSILNNGLLWMGEWIGLPFYLSLLICAIIGFTLFMTLFELDAWETQMSIVAINVVQFVARFILIGLLVAGARHNEKKKEREQFEPPIEKPADKGKIPDDDDEP